MASTHSNKQSACTVASLKKALRRDRRIVAMLGRDAIEEFAWEFVKRRMMRAQGYDHSLSVSAAAA